MNWNDLDRLPKEERERIQKLCTNRAWLVWGWWVALLVIPPLGFLGAKLQWTIISSKDGINIGLMVGCALGAVIAVSIVGRRAERYIDRFVKTLEEYRSTEHLP